MGRKLEKLAMKDTETGKIVERWVEVPDVKITVGGIFRLIGVGINHLWLRIIGKR